LHLPFLAPCPIRGHPACGGPRSPESPATAIAGIAGSIIGLPCPYVPRGVLKSLPIVESQDAQQRTSTEAEMANQGTVKFYNGQKGFGFIQPDNGGPDVFVHATALEAAGIPGLAEGQKVSFEVVSDRGKTKAASLELVV